LAEAESELVAGFHTEYSGLRWSVFFMAEYGSMFVVSALAVILFFGGWNGPIPIFQPFAYQPGEADWRLMGYVANLAGCMNFLLKTVVGVVVMMWIRWTLPRLRIDQVITMCWKYCVPIAAACFVGALFWQAYDLPSPGTLVRAEVREGWVIAEQQRLAQQEAAQQAADQDDETEVGDDDMAAAPRSLPVDDKHDGSAVSRVLQDRSVRTNQIVRGEVAPEVASGVQP
jgi:NADH-quinone oxidoreductase subunit H